MGNGIYRRRILIFFVSILFFTSLSGLLAFNIDLATSRKVSKELSLERELYLIQNNLNNQMTILFNYIGKLRSSDQAYLWADATGGNYYYHMKQIQKMLASNQTSLNGVEYNFGISFEGNKASIVTARESYSKEEYFKQFGMTPMDVAKMALRIKYRENNQTGIIEISETVKGHKYIHYIIDANYLRQNLVFYLTLSLDTIMEPFNSVNCKWMITDNSKVLASKEDISDKDLILDSFNYLKAGKPLHFIDKVEVNKSINYKMPFPFIGLDFICSTRVEWYSFEDYIMFLLIPFICILIIIYFISNFITDILYKPIVKLINITSTADSIKDDRDEFQGIINNTNALISANKEMSYQVKQNRERLRKHTVKEFILGNETLNEDYIEDFYNDNSSYRVALIYFKFDDGNYNNRSIISADLKNIVDIKTFFTSKNICCLIIKDMEEEKIRSFLTRIVSSIEEKSDAHVKISLSSSEIGFKNIPKGYTEASQILEYKYLMNKQLILSKELLEQTDYQKDFYYPLSLENMIINLTIKGDYKVISILKDLLNENLNIRNIVKDERKKLVISLKGTIVRIFHELKIEANSVYSENINLYNSLEDNWFNNNIDENLIELYETILKRINEEDNQAKDELKIKMLKYISDNYYDDIMLIDMAEELNMSLKYSSALFKKLIGQNFKDYLNHYRIDKAKEILEDKPESKVCDVAKSIGFNSSNTFIRVFKKYVGTSPGTYVDRL